MSAANNLRQHGIKPLLLKTHFRVGDGPVAGETSLGMTRGKGANAQDKGSLRHAALALKHVRKGASQKSIHAAVNSIDRQQFRWLHGLPLNPAHLPQGGLMSSKIRTAKPAIAVALAAALASIMAFSFAQQAPKHGPHFSFAHKRAAFKEENVVPEVVVSGVDSEGTRTGVAVSREGRIFVNFPRWSPNVLVSVAEIISGGETKPFPDAEWNRWDIWFANSPQPYRLFSFKKPK
jgi:hypothetical protein